MDELIIYSKIDSLKRCIERIKSKSPESLEILKSDLDCQDIIILNLERSVQICVDIAAYIIAELDVQAPLNMSDGFNELGKIGIIDKKTAERMRKSVGFRNIAVHEYSKVSWEIVYSIIKKDLSDFRHFARNIIQWLEKKEDSV